MNFLKRLFNDHTAPAAQESPIDDHISKWRRLRDSRSYESFAEPIRDFVDQLIKKNRDTLGLGKAVYINEWPPEGLQPNDLNELETLFKWIGFVTSRKPAILSARLYPLKRLPDHHPYIVELWHRGSMIREEVRELAREFVAYYKHELENGVYIPFPDSLTDRHRLMLFREIIHQLDLYSTRRDGVECVTAVPQEKLAWKLID